MVLQLLILASSRRSINGSVSACAVCPARSSIPVCVQGPAESEERTVVMLQLLMWQLREQQAQCRRLIEGEQGQLQLLPEAKYKTFAKKLHAFRVSVAQNVRLHKPCMCMLSILMHVCSLLLLDAKYKTFTKMLQSFRVIEEAPRPLCQRGPARALAQALPNACWAFPGRLNPNKKVGAPAGGQAQHFDKEAPRLSCQPGPERALAQPLHVHA